CLVDGEINEDFGGGGVSGRELQFAKVLIRLRERGKMAQLTKAKRVIEGVASGREMVCVELRDAQIIPSLRQRILVALFIGGIDRLCEAGQRGIRLPGFRAQTGNQRQNLRSYP